LLIFFKLPTVREFLKRVPRQSLIVHHGVEKKTVEYVCTIRKQKLRITRILLRGFVTLCEKKRSDEVSLWVMVTPLVPSFDRYCKFEATASFLGGTTNQHEGKPEIQP